MLIDVERIAGPAHAVIGHSFGGASLGAALALGFRPGRLVIASAPTRVSRIPLMHARRLGLPPRAMRQFERMLDEYAGRPFAELDLVATAPRCGIPALLVHDREDEVIPYADAEALIALWPELEVLSTQGFGHRDILSHASVVGRIAEFIDSPG
jgi:pimeloyl-ACP methyl ester carboxylesterase